MFDRNDPATTLFFIIVTFVSQRLYLHLINRDTDLYIRGHNVHHLFVGAVTALPAAFLLAFRPSVPWLSLGALAMLGSGSAMVLDQIVFLIATDGSNASYVKPLSLWNAMVMETLGMGLLLLIYFLS